jgi:O-antigen/teichoic acid export membrane protein
MLILRPVKGDTVAGYYQVALQVTQFLLLAPQALQVVFSMELAPYWRDIDVISRITNFLTRLTLSLLLLLSIGVAILAEPFIMIYFGEKYLAAVGPLLVLLPGIIFYAMFYMVWGVQLSHESPRWVAIATGLVAAVNLILNLGLVPQYGMLGAATASSISYALLFVGSLVSIRLMGVSYSPWSIPVTKLTISSVLTAGVLWWFSTMINGPIVKLLSLPPIGAVIFTMLIYKMGIVGKEDFEFVRSL